MVKNLIGTQRRADGAKPTIRGFLRDSRLQSQSLVASQWHRKSQPPLREQAGEIPAPPSFGAGEVDAPFWHTVVLLYLLVFVP